MWNISLPNTLIIPRPFPEGLLMSPDLRGLLLLVWFWSHSVGGWPCFPPVEPKRACRIQHLPELVLDFVSSMLFITIHHKQIKLLQPPLSARHASSTHVCFPSAACCFPYHSFLLEQLSFLSKLKSLLFFNRELELLLQQVSAG